MSNIYEILDTLFKDNFSGSIGSEFKDRNPIILECGGHVGTDTKRLAEHFPHSTIYTLEANKDLYEKHLIPLSESYNSIKPFNLALADKNGDTTFYIDGNEQGNAGASSLLEASDSYLRNYIKKEIQVQVKCTRLTDFMKNEILVPPLNLDLLWLDIEGYEYYILNDSIDILSKIKYIYTEVNFQQFRKNGKLYNDVKKLLTRHGFIEIKRWEQGAKWGDWQGNVLFKNKNIKDLNILSSIKEEQEQISNIDDYKEYMEKAAEIYCIPGYKGRYHTFKYIHDALTNIEKPIIAELGTSRSFVDGKYEGCMSKDLKYWEPNNPEKWDWGAGIFTVVMSKTLKNAELHSVDCSQDNLYKSKRMCPNTHHHLSTSESFLEKTVLKYDLIYIDTGNIDEETAKLQLAEAKIIVKRNLIKPGGYILIDDVRNAAFPLGGKAKYSIEFLKKNGFTIIMDEYQVLLKNTNTV